MSRPRMMIVAGLICAVSGIANSALAQKPSSVNAATQARDRMLQSHNQTGSFVGGYRPFSAWSYQNSARTHAQALNGYGQSCPQVPPETAREHLTAIRKDLAAARKELSKFSADAAKQADVKEHVDAIQKHQDAVAELCDRMEQAIGDKKVDCAELCACCQGIDEELKAADAEHRALLDKIGIKLPGGDAGAHAEHKQAPATTPQAKEGKK
ncbi:MAG: hypothetical protein U0992_12200 [Planctomycetaceae bacterium]